MKIETVQNTKKFSGKKCSVCGKGAVVLKQVVTVTVPNFGFTFTHKSCAHDILGPSDDEIMTEWREIRNYFKENNGICIEG